MDDSHRSESRFGNLPLAQREVALLLILAVVAGVMFSITRVFAEWSRRERAREASEWYRRGEDALAAGQTTRGLDALRRATLGDRTNRSYALALARGLLAANQAGEASRILNSLREVEPDDPEINSRLARLAVSRGNVPEALRFYHHAMYGAAPADSAFSRRRIALELTTVLLDAGDRDGALAELIALSRDRPATGGEGQIRIAHLFLKAGDPSRALAHFLEAAKVPPAGPAWAGAAAASAEMHDFRAALRYAQTALREGPSQEALAIREFAERVLASDPLVRGISASERERRLTAGLEYAAAPCDGGAATTSGNPELDQLRRGRHGPRDLDVLRQGVAAIARAITAANCGARELDRVWLTIAASHGGAAP